MIFKQIQHGYDFHAIQNYHMSIYRRSIDKEQGESLPQMERPYEEDEGQKPKCSKSLNFQIKNEALNPLSLSYKGLSIDLH